MNSTNRADGSHSAVTADLPQSDSTFQVVVLSGPSGSGKTTIINRLLGATPGPADDVNLGDDAATPQE